MVYDGFVFHSESLLRKVSDRHENQSELRFNAVSNRSASQINTKLSIEDIKECCVKEGIDQDQSQQFIMDIYHLFEQGFFAHPKSTPKTIIKYIFH